MARSILFTNQIQKGAALPPEHDIVRGFHGKLERVSDEQGQRKALFLINDERVARDGHIFRTSGMDVQAWAEHGSWLWGHDASDPSNVMGRPGEVYKRGEELYATIEFVPGEINPMAEMAYQMTKNGFMRGSSIRIFPHEVADLNHADGSWGLDFTRSDVIETSLTPIPANPGAVLQAVRSAGSQFDQKLMREWAEEILSTTQPAQAVKATAPAPRLTPTSNELHDIITAALIASFRR